MKSAEEWSARIDQEKLLSRSTVKIVKQIRAEAFREAARIVKEGTPLGTCRILDVTQFISERITAKADEVEKI